MTTVVYNNEKYDSDLSFNLLENLKRVFPDMKVTITSANGSSYKEVKNVRVDELEDWSVVRNLRALAN